MEMFEDVALLEPEELEQIIANNVEEVTLQVAVDSGSCANVAHPDDMPKGGVTDRTLMTNTSRERAATASRSPAHTRPNAPVVMANSQRTGVAPR